MHDSKLSACWQGVFSLPAADAGTAVAIAYNPHSIL